MGNGWVAYEGPSGDNSAHSHHAIQLSLSPGGVVRMEIDGILHNAPALLVGADTRHRLMHDSHPLRLLFIDAQSTAGQCLSGDLSDSCWVLEPSQAEALNLAWAPEAWLSEPGPPKSVLAVLLQSCRLEDRPGSPGAERVQALIDTLPLRCHQDLRLADLANEAALSPSRFSYLFRELTSMPLRPYLRWLRLRQALQKVSAGQNLTEAAHAAGFSDAAHLSRTMRRHFGIAPSEILPAMSIHQ